MISIGENNYMAELKHTFKTDTLFKMLFVKYPDLLKKLVAALLKIQYESIKKFEIRNPEMPPESLGSKFCRLDINMMVNGQRVDLEVQVENEGNYPERTLFHWAREFSTALPAGEDFSQLPRTIIINIVNFKLFNCTEYHSEFQPLEVTRQTPLTDKMTLHFFELKKLPKEISKDNLLLLWLALFKANTEEELLKIQSLEVPIMDQAIGAFRSITASSEFQELERLREKARHDEAQALYHAKLEAKKEERITFAKKLLNRNRPIDEIVEDTGLTREEVENLRD
jgi:predicted transposase/invertase (TIGR01784 family)